MEKRTVTYKCGHQEEREFRGAPYKIDAQVKYLEQRLCKACWAAQQNSTSKPTATIQHTRDLTEIAVSVRDAFPVKDQLKPLGFSWNNTAKTWTWWTHVPDYATLDQVKAMAAKVVKILKEIQQIGVALDEKATRFLEKAEQL